MWVLLCCLGYQSPRAEIANYRWSCQFCILHCRYSTKTTKGDRILGPLYLWKAIGPNCTSSPETPKVGLESAAASYTEPLTTCTETASTLPTELTWFEFALGNSHWQKRKWSCYANCWLWWLVSGFQHRLRLPRNVEQSPCSPCSHQDHQLL